MVITLTHTILNPLKYIITILCYLLYLKASFAQNALKFLSANRITESIKIDGKLTENVWKTANIATNFVQKEPTPNVAPTYQSEFYFLYDDHAVYIGARMYDDNPESILKELSLRDQIGNADNFRVFFDPYKSGLNGFIFYVTASGVQYEASVSDQIDDPNWNAVWQSEVSFDEKGWLVEMKIPYSSLRFPTNDIQNWGLQIGREIRRLREVSYWSPIDPAISGWVQQSGQITNLENIKSPTRLSLTPYLSTYLNSTYDPNITGEKFGASNAFSAGLDLKYGINDAFTLDMTLVPDFGQVISDKQVLNLSPFEIFFEENRQFFTEGTELFNKGRLFYSRRIGDTPIGFQRAFTNLGRNEYVKENPQTTQLYNATKISGRTSRNTGIGGFNAVVGESYATIGNISSQGGGRRVMTNPLTNYNVLVVDQNLKNNSFISLINTNVMRRGADYDANVTGAFTSLKTKNQQYGFSGAAISSQRFFTDSVDLGYSYYFSMGKISGNWTYELSQGIESANYNPNDLGFIFSPNENFISLDGKYAQYKPKNKKLQEYNIASNITYSRLYTPNVYTDHYTTINSFFLFKTRFAIGGNMRLEPANTYDYFEPRTGDFSRRLLYPVNYGGGGFVSSDYRKPVAYDIKFNYRWYNADNRKNITVSVGPRLRFNDQLSLFLTTSFNWLFQEPGYVNKANVASDIGGFDNAKDILFGNRNRQIIENTINGKYTFNSKMNLNLRIRHYWDKVEYQSFGRLDDDGYVQVLDYDGLTDTEKPIFDRNVNIFNVDLQYNWRFAPGSDIIFVWKNQITNADDDYNRNYFQNLNGIFDAIQGNSLSLRIIYFLDYQSVVGKKI
jgi:Domain of unknown function (DUF5916)/Carbohydrate family 9 binding domain-like